MPKKHRKRNFSPQSTRPQSPENTHHHPNREMSPNSTRPPSPEKNKHKRIKLVSSRQSLLVTFNLNGQKYQMPKNFFQELPIHDQIISLAVETFNEGTKETEYFLDNDRESFSAIIDFYKSGELHIPRNVCPNIFKRELYYWGLDADNLKTCCFIEFAKFNSDQSSAKEFRKFIRKISFVQMTKGMPPWKALFFRFLNDHKSSKWALLYRYLTFMIIFVLLFTAIMHTDRHTFASPLTNDEWEEYSKYQNDLREYCQEMRMTNQLYEVCTINQPDVVKATAKSFGNEGDCQNCTSLPADIGSLPSWTWGFDVFCLLWIAIHYGFTVCLTPTKKEYALSFSGIAEVLVILHEIGELIASEIFPWLNYKTHWFTICLYSTRVLLMFIIARTSLFFQVVSYSVRKAAHDLCIIMLFFLMSSGVFAMLLLGAEIGNIPSFFDAYWHTVGIMTTSAFDFGPADERYVSHILCGVLTLFGLVFLSINAPIFLDSFGFYYKVLKLEEHMEIYQKAREEKNSPKEGQLNNQKSVTDKIGEPGHVSKTDFGYDESQPQSAVPSRFGSEVDLRSVLTSGSREKPPHKSESRKNIETYT